jgi:hypothetical protein
MVLRDCHGRGFISLEPLEAAGERGGFGCNVIIVIIESVGVGEGGCGSRGGLVRISFIVE